MATLICKRFARFGCLLALMIGTVVSTASAETLMMPDREVVKGTQTVVWGVTTQANGTPYTIDFGDGSAILSGNVVDRSYIAFNYTYLLAGSPEVTATLTVGTGPSEEVATVKIQTWDPADPLVATQLRNIGINMAIQDGLRYLWVSQSDRANQFPANVMTHWDGSSPNSWTALVTLAFENQGYGIPNDNSTPTGLYQKYIVQRGLNYVINSLGKITSSPTVYQYNFQYGQYGYPYNSYPACLPWCSARPAVASGAQPAGDPRVGVPNDADLGVLLFGEGIDHSAYGTSVVMLPIAASGAMNRTVSGIPGSGSGGFVVGRTYGEVLQRLSNGLVWGQIDSGSGQGGWGYALNPGGGSTIAASTSAASASDGSTVGWGVLALLDAEAAGITVPAFAKSQFQIAYNNAINSDGSFDYSSDQNATSTGADPIYRNMTRAGVGLEGLFYTGVHGGAAFAGNAQGQAALSFLSSRWGGANSGFGDYIDTCAGTGAGQNKGCAYAMFNIFKGLKLQGVTTLPGAIFRPADATHAANDWYADYQDWLVANQTSANDKNGGYWGSMRFSCCANDTAPNAALAELVLSPVALVLPDATKFSTAGLTPPTGSSLTGLTHTVVAHAESTGGTPVPGATVVFKVLTGPNAGKTGSATTNGAGDASWTYTDLGAGTDTIQAKIGTTLTSNSVTMDWTIRTVNPSVFANNKVYDGTTAASLNGCTVSGALASPPADPVACSGTATFADKNAAFGKAVTVTGITLTGLGAPNYVLSTTTATTIADITPKPASVVPNAALKEYGDADPTFVANLSGFLPVDGVSATIARAPGQTVAASPYTLTATLSAVPMSALNNYSVTNNPNVLFITRKSAVVMIAAQTKVYGSLDPVLTGTLGGFLPADAVTAAYSRAAGETVTGGPYLISAVLSPTAVLNNYSIITLPASLTITPKPVIVSAVAQTKTYGSADPPLTYTITSGGPLVGTDTFTGALTRVAGTNVGGYAINQGTLSLGPNYTLTFVSANLTVTPKTASVTVAAAAKAYGSLDPTLTGTLAGFLPGDGVTASYSRTAGETVLGGPYTISATLNPAGVLGNYTITNTPAAFTITAIAASVTPNAASKPYGSSDPTLTGTLGGFLPGDGVTASYSRTAGETVLGGPYTISAVLGPAVVLSNYVITSNTAAFTITAKAASVTPNAAAKPYGAADPTLTGTLVGFMPSDGVTASYSRTAGETVLGGPYTISAVLGPAAVLSNYAITSNTAAFTIDAIAVSVTPNAASKPYGAADPTLTGTLVGFLPGDGVSASYSRTAGETVLGGPYTISAVLGPATVLGNYVITSNTAAFTIDAIAASVTPNASGKTYGSADPTLTGTLAGFLAADGVSASYSRTGGETVGGNPYTISAVLSPAAVLSNYVITSNTAAFTIDPKAASVTVAAASKSYGAADPTLTGTLVGFELADGVTASYSRTTGETVLGGPYTITATVSPAAVLGNYTITNTPAAFTITAITASVTPNAASKSYGAADPTLTGTLAGFLPGDGVTASYSRTGGETVLGGPYTISAVLGPAAVLSNYVITSNTAAFTIDAIAASVTPNAASKTYGAGDPTLTGTLVGFLPADSVSASYSRTAGETVGGNPYSISAVLSPAAVLSNYTITYDTAGFTINQLAATVTAGGGTKVYGSADPAITASQTGFLPADGIVIGATRAAGETVGSYTTTATAAGGLLANYAVNYLTGTFTITQATLTVTTPNQTKVYGSANPALTAMVSGQQLGDIITVATVTTPATAASVVGTYPISTTLADPGGRLANYIVINGGATLSITSKAVTVTATNRVKGLGQTVAFAGTEFTTSGLVPGDTVSSVTLTSAGAAASAAVAGSPYAIVPSAAMGTGLSNYTISYVNGTLTVVKAAPSTGSIWPPNHNMVPITVSVANGGAPAVCAITSVTSSEPISGLGGGDTAPDWSFAPGSLTVNLRSERSGGGSGRTYTIFVTCTLPSGSSTVTTTTVAVAHNQ